MLYYLHKTPGLVRAFYDKLIVTILSAFMFVPDYLARDLIGPFQVLCELGREGAHVTREFRTRHAEINWQLHLSAKREAESRKARRFRDS